MKKKYKELQIGMSLWDMHDRPALENGLWLAEPHKIIQWVRLEMKGGSAFIDRNMTEGGIRRYTNKMLVVMDTPYNSSGNVHKIKAAYSYDDTLFGLVEIEVTLPDGYFDE